MENDGRETVDEIEVTHLDEPISDFTFMPIFNQLFHKPSETEQKSAHKKAARTAKSRMIPCVLYFFVLLHSLIYQASGLSAVECLVYATLKAHYIFLLIIILLSSLSVAKVNVPGVCFFAILRQHTNYLF